MFICLILLFLVGCSNQVETDEIVCNEPYIRFGADCCLDENNNKVCDNDEELTDSAVEATTIKSSSEEIQGQVITEEFDQSLYGVKFDFYTPLNQVKDNRWDIERIFLKIKNSGKGLISSKATISLSKLNYETAKYKETAKKTIILPQITSDYVTDFSADDFFFEHIGSASKMKAKYLLEINITESDQLLKQETYEFIMDGIGSGNHKTEHNLTTTRPYEDENLNVPYIQIDFGPADFIKISDDSVKIKEVPITITNKGDLNLKDLTIFIHEGNEITKEFIDEDVSNGEEYIFEYEINEVVKSDRGVSVEVFLLKKNGFETIKNANKDFKVRCQKEGELPWDTENEISVCEVS